jgi:hypothetical protein
MQMTKSCVLAVPAQRVWEVLGEGFGDLRWVRSIRASQLDGEVSVGAVRRCEFEPSLLVSSGVAHERLVDFDPSRRTLAYALVEPSGPILEAGSRWSVEAVEGGARVTVTSTIVLRAWAWPMTPMLRVFIGRMARQTLDDLEGHVMRAPPADGRTPPLSHPLER